MSTIDFTFGEVIDESVERAGLDPSALTHVHLNSITRSLQLLFTEIEAKGASDEYRTDTIAVDLPQSWGAVQLPADTIDVSQVTLVRDGRPIPLGRTKREDFQTLSYPQAAGHPSIYWLSKSKPPESLFLTSTLGADYVPSLNFSDPRNTQNFFLYPAWPVGGPPMVNGEGPFMVVWPMNGLGDVKMTVTRVRQRVMPVGFGEQVDAGRPWFETIIRGLAAAVAEKYNPDIWPRLYGRYKEALNERDAEEDHHPVKIGFRGFGFSRERRH
jgi:hypothetical protein